MSAIELSLGPDSSSSGCGVPPDAVPIGLPSLLFATSSARNTLSFTSVSMTALIVGYTLFELPGSASLVTYCPPPIAHALRSSVTLCSRF
jgi:hypothetical protein